MTNKTIELIKTTIPLIKENKEEITTTMYDIMFTRYPKVKELFKNAEPLQYKKLANAIYAYAANIDNLQALNSGINNMAKVHVQTNVKPEHYPIVGECLIDAITQVLKPSKEILEAWTDAYKFLANVLIEKEKELYAKKL